MGALWAEYVARTRARCPQHKRVTDTNAPGLPGFVRRGDRLELHVPDLAEWLEAGAPGRPTRRGRRDSCASSRAG